MSKTGVARAPGQSLAGQDFLRKSVEIDWSAYPDFTAEEFACKCCGANFVHWNLVELLQRARTLAGVPFRINSGCRCPAHNAAVGGHPESYHKKGMAADISCVDDETRYKMLHALYTIGFWHIGIYPTFIHVDIGQLSPRRSWVRTG